jgi:hypothetical protein
MLRRLFRKLMGTCPECGEFMRLCQSSVSRGGGRVWLEPSPHGRKCVSCGHYEHFGA